MVLEPQQALQDRAAGEQRVEGAPRDPDVQKAELLEERQMERAGGVPVREAAAAEAGSAEGGREAGSGGGSGRRGKIRWKSSS